MGLYIPSNQHIILMTSSLFYVWAKVTLTKNKKERLNTYDHISDLLVLLKIARNIIALMFPLNFSHILQETCWMFVMLIIVIYSDERAIQGYLCPLVWNWNIMLKKLVLLKMCILNNMYMLAFTCVGCVFFIILRILLLTDELFTLILKTWLE